MLEESPINIDDGIGLKNLPCVSCCKEASKFCSGCNVIKYCGEECQRSHWPEHKLVCKEVPRMLKTLSNLRKGREMQLGKVRLLDNKYEEYARKRLNQQVRKLMDAQNVSIVATGKDIAESTVNNTVNNTVDNEKNYTLPKTNILVAVFYTNCVFEHPNFCDFRAALSRCAMSQFMDLSKRIFAKLGMQYNRFVLSEERIYLMLFGYDINFTNMVAVYKKFARIK